jgi:hypothetical protein
VMGLEALPTADVEGWETTALIAISRRA